MWSDKHQKIGIFQGGEQSGGTGEQRGYETPQGYFVSDQCYHELGTPLGDNNENNESPEEVFILPIPGKYTLWGPISG